MSYESLKEILTNVKKHGWSAENVSFGSGGEVLGSGGEVLGEWWPVGEELFCNRRGCGGIFLLSLIIRLQYTYTA